MLSYSSNWHTSYPAFQRHWHSGSEKFAGGDALLTAIDSHWEVSLVCYLEEYWHAGTRLVTLYHFELNREGETMVMTVITTPYVRRIIREQQFQVRPIAERSDRVRKTST
ncbi:MAG: hypothetical protein SGJ24_18765 [Chloroflexota bacterium]|nr:hypothetical protein [Chloroflexota bacterium]